MRISVLGAGYVGAVTAACLARDGHEVVAVDTDGEKVAALAAGRSPIVERGLADLIGTAVAAGRLTATGDTAAALRDTDLSLVCVGTPSREDGELDTSHILRAAGDIGRALAGKDARHAVVVRSTVLPGTTENLIVPALEAASGKRAGADIGVAYYPEFMREGASIEDFDDPGTIVVGVSDDETRNLLRTLLAPRIPREVPIATAEAVKYANNAWHALKVSFANEIGLLTRAIGVDSHDVMDVLVSDTRLNMSPAYLTPGFAFGGSCLPKDVAALRHRAVALGLATPVLDAVLAANERQIEEARRLVMVTGGKRVGVIGLGFKPGTDDMRSSPLVELAARLIASGLSVRAYDPVIRAAKLTGANRAFVDRRLPDMAGLLVADAAELIAGSDVVVIGNARLAAPIMADIERAGLAIVDLVRVDRARRSAGRYAGIAW